MLNKTSLFAFLMLCGLISYSQTVYVTNNTCFDKEIHVSWDDTKCDTFCQIFSDPNYGGHAIIGILIPSGMTVTFNFPIIPCNNPQVFHVESKNINNSSGIAHWYREGCGLSHPGDDKCKGEFPNVSIERTSYNSFAVNPSI